VNYVGSCRVCEITMEKYLLMSKLGVNLIICKAINAEGMRNYFSMLGFAQSSD